MTKAKTKRPKPRPRPKPKGGPYRYGRLLLAPLLLLTGCASFAHGIVTEKEAVLASFDDVQKRADEAYGLTVGAPLSVLLAGCRFGVVVTLAGMSGVAHIPSGIVGCPFCDAEVLRAQATTRPAGP